MTLALSMLVCVACTPSPSSPQVRTIKGPEPHSPSDCPPKLAPPGDYAVGHLPRLVPPGPATATVCRYARRPGQSPDDDLARSATLTATGLTSLVTRLNDLAPQTAVTEPINCNPATDNGSADEVRFHYADGQVVPVDITLTGCPVATSTASGKILVLFGPSTETGHEVIDQLASVVGPSS